MLCQNCGQRPATVHIVKQVNNHKEEYHLCEACAREQGQFSMELPNFSLQQLLASMLEEGPWGPMPGSLQAPAETRCPSCGLTFRQFKERGFFGCGQCYTTFEGELLPLLRRMQGSDRHVGKAPRRTGGRLRVRRELEQLRQQLQRAIAAEEYEKAAELRDRIRVLEQRLEAGGEGGAVE